MKKLFLCSLSTFFFVLQIASTSAQTVDDLDTNGGFKDFKIGDPKSKWSQFLINPSTTLANTYEYSGSCCSTAFGYSLQRIGLTFNDKDKLEKIWLIYKDRQQAAGQRQLYNTLVAAFGKPTGGKADDNSGDMTFEWDGKKIVLAMINTYKGAAEGGWEIAIMIVDVSATTNPAKDY